MSWLTRFVLINRFDILTLGSENSRLWWVGTRLLDSLSEFLACVFTAVVLFTVTAYLEPMLPWGALAVAAAYGMATTAVVAVFAPPPSVARTHGNGVVTLAAAALGFRSILHALMLLAAQALGYLLGTYVASRLVNLHIPLAQPVGGATLLSTFLAELVVGAAVGFGFLVVTSDSYPSVLVPREKEGRDHYAASLVVGVLTACGSATGLLMGTGGALHFWHYLAPAILSGEFPAWWIYLLATLGAAALVAIVYLIYDYWVAWSICFNAVAEAEWRHMQDCYRADEMCRLVQRFVPEAERRTIVEPLIRQWTTSTSTEESQQLLVDTKADGRADIEMTATTTTTTRRHQAATATATPTGPAVTQVPVFGVTAGASPVGVMPTNARYLLRE